MPTTTLAVVAYVTHGDRLLICSQPHAPAADLQVPAGTVLPDESPESAVLREAMALTGLADLELVGFLGEKPVAMVADGDNASQHDRRFYHLHPTSIPPELWDHQDPHASDDGPIPLCRCWWVRLPDEVPVLVPGQDALLPTLVERLRLLRSDQSEAEDGGPGPAVLRYYNRGREAAWLERHGVERARTEELLTRFLPPPPATILDVGGGSGVYALPLAAQGYAVHLVDLVPLHLEQARQAAAAQPAHPLASLRLGDARALDQPNASVDAVLLFGPLYHLTERADRLRALGEALRVVRPGGVVLAVGISRFASLLDGLYFGFLDDPAFQPIVARDLRDGRHRNPTATPSYFTTAFFHHPDELRQEAAEVGLVVEALLAIEGPSRVVSDLNGWWTEQARRERLLAAIRAVEAEPSLLGLSPHILVVGRRPEGSAHG